MTSIALAAKLALVNSPLRRLIQARYRLYRQMPEMATLYSEEAPSAANALGIFKGQWNSKIDGFDTGEVNLFDDSRIKWLSTQLGGFDGKRILELGPLEAGQTTMMEKAGADVLAIEASQRAFLKCLVVKEVMGLRSKFMFGDFRPYLRTCSERFDFVLACAVLYHMTNPVDLIRDIAKVTDRFGMWTAYYDDKIVHAKAELLAKFDPEPVEFEQDGFRTSGYRYNYMVMGPNPKFCGGTAPTSVWLTRECLLVTIEKLGFKVTITDDDPHHQVGPAVLLYASR